MRLGPVIPFVAALFLAAVAAVPAHADGTVERATGCGDTMFISSADGYSILTVTGEPGVKDGDAIVGRVDGIGYTELYDRTRSIDFSAIVEDHRLSLDDVTSRIAVTCRSELANDVTTGTVVRSDGCGNRVFVSAPEGFAILDRLAGGIVGKDDVLTGNFNRPGRATVKDTQTGSILTVFVEDYQLSRAAIDRRISTLCPAAR